MAANYWDSTQAQHWTFTKPGLAQLRTSLAAVHPTLTQKHPALDPRHLSIYLQAQLLKLARRLNLRQQALATAQIYLKRYYLLVPLAATNPYLLLSTAAYLAGKVEESPQHIRLVVAEALRLWPTELGPLPLDQSKVGECEFALISALGSRLILHHPYRALGDFTALWGLGPEEAALAAGVVNDAFCTDLALLHPPHVLAIAAIFLAVVLRPAGPPAGLQAHAVHPAGAPGGATGPSVGGAAAQSALAGFAGLKQAGPKLGRLVDWLAESQVKVEAVVEATQELVSLYECWEGYSERGCRDAIARILRDGAGGSK